MQIYHVPGNQGLLSTELLSCIFLFFFLFFSFFEAAPAILELTMSELTEIHSLVSASQLELKACTTMPSTQGFSWQVCQNAMVNALC